MQMEDGIHRRDTWWGHPFNRDLSGHEGFKFHVFGRRELPHEPAEARTELRGGMGQVERASQISLESVSLLEWFVHTYGPFVDDVN